MQTMSTSNGFAEICRISGGLSGRKRQVTKNIAVIYSTLRYFGLEKLLQNLSIKSNIKYK